MLEGPGDERLRIRIAVILRWVVVLGAVLLALGLVLAGAIDPTTYVRRFRELQAGGALHGREDWLSIIADTFHGQARPVLMLGLLALSLVPLLRVGYAFTFFVRRRDRMFSLLTGIVLALLAAGVLLGRLG